MKISFRTNLDVTETWPDNYTYPPSPGDIVTSKAGLQLEVRRKTFTGGFAYVPYYDGNSVEQRCECELNLINTRFENMTEFDSWYEKWKKNNK